VSRSTLKAIDALDLSKRWVAGKAAAGHRPALLFLLLLPRTAALRTLNTYTQMKEFAVRFVGARRVTPVGERKAQQVFNYHKGGPE
jgi:hypothetical protein